MQRMKFLCLVWTSKQVDKFKALNQQLLLVKTILSSFNSWREKEEEKEEFLIFLSFENIKTTMIIIKRQQQKKRIKCIWTFGLVKQFEFLGKEQL